MDPKQKGLFLTFEGLDGSGKTCLADKLSCWLKAQGYEVEYVSSVGFEPIDRVTTLLLEDKSIYDPYAHLFLSYANSRVLIKTVIEPGIRGGKVVILDRYFHSSIAYSLPLGLPRDWMSEISSVLLKPDKVIYCDVSIETALIRKGERIANVEVGFQPQINPSDAFRTYQTKVKEGYEAMIREDPDQFIVIPNENILDTAEADLITKMENFLHRRKEHS